MKRKLLSCVLAVVLLWGFAEGAQAVSGSITVNVGEQTRVSLYLMGSWEDGGYRLLEQYGGGWLSYDDVLSEDLALWLATRAQGGISRETKGEKVKFTDLNEGLYLVAPDPENMVFRPFFVSLPWDGSMWEVEISPELEASTPETGDFVGLRLSAVLMMVSMLGLLVIGSRKKY